MKDIILMDLAELREYAAEKAECYDIIKGEHDTVWAVHHKLVEVNNQLEQKLEKIKGIMMSLPTHYITHQEKEIAEILDSQDTRDGTDTILRPDAKVVMDSQESKE